MSYTNAQKARVLIGALSYTGYTRSIDTSDSTEMLDVTTLADEASAYIPGLSDSTFSLDMVLDSTGTAGGQFAHFTSWKAAASQPMSYMPQGLTAGSIAQMYSTLQSQCMISSAPNQAVGASLQAQSVELTDLGIVIENLTAITIDTNGSSVDNGAATTNGGVWHVHVTAYSGLTSDSIVLEHSTNNSTWATLDTATSVTATGSERRVIAAGTTINRYVRVRDDVTGAGSITRAVTLARR